MSRKFESAKYIFQSDMHDAVKEWMMEILDAKHHHHAEEAEKYQSQIDEVPRLDSDQVPEELIHLVEEQFQHFQQLRRAQADYHRARQQLAEIELDMLRKGIVVAAPEATGW